MTEAAPPQSEPGPPRAKKGTTKPAQKALAEVSSLRTRVKQLEQDLHTRVSQLEQEVQECRQLNKRLAEIADVVAEVLLPAEHRDEERLRSLLADYERTI
jgi:oligoendopeptidase F